MRFNNRNHGGKLDVSQLTYVDYGIYNGARVFVVDGTGDYEDRMTQDHLIDRLLRYPTTRLIPSFGNSVSHQAPKGHASACPFVFS